MILLILCAFFWTAILCFALSAPPNRLNAILSLLQPLDCFWTSSDLASTHIQPRDSGAIVSKTPLKRARDKNKIEAALS